MGKFDFDEIVSRKGTNSYKWDNDIHGDMIQMGVADMDFRVAPSITDALQQRVGHGVFGYTKVPGEYYDVLTGWFSRRHGWKIPEGSVIHVPGVVPALTAVIKALTVPGDKVLIQTPVYNCFFSSVRNNGCITEESLLVREGNTYRVDFDDFERRASDPAVKVFILCNPHNPAGRVWTVEELTRMGDICLRNNVFVIADEIHCEFVYGDNKYIPFASISDDFARNSVTCISPSKAFNIAGLQIANIVCPAEDVFRKVETAVNANEIRDANPFGVLGLMAAYDGGQEWLDELLVYLYDNYLYLRNFFEERMPRFPVLELEGTYLVWADISSSGLSSSEITGKLLDEAHVRVNDGTMYGDAGEGFVRINIACPRSRLAEGLERIARCLSDM